MNKVKVVSITGALIASEVAIFIIAAKMMTKTVDAILERLMTRYKD